MPPLWLARPDLLAGLHASLHRDACPAACPAYLHPVRHDVGAGRLDDHVLVSGPGKGARYTRVLMAQLRKRDGDNCRFCGKPLDFTLPYGFGMGASIDHIRPKAAGGGNGKQNLQILHTMPCQKRKGSWWNGVDYARPENKGRHDTMSGVYRLGTGDRAD